MCKIRYTKSYYHCKKLLLRTDGVKLSHISYLTNTNLHVKYSILELLRGERDIAVRQCGQFLPVTDIIFFFFSLLDLIGELKAFLKSVYTSSTHVQTNKCQYYLRLDDSLIQCK